MAKKTATTASDGHPVDVTAEEKAELVRRMYDEKPPKQRAEKG